VQQTGEGIEACAREWNANGFGLFAVEIRATGEPADSTGLSCAGLRVRGNADSCRDWTSSQLMQGEDFVSVFEPDAAPSVISIPYPHVQSSSRRSY
jgi:hypothetical protein